MLAQGVEAPVHGDQHRCGPLRLSHQLPNMADEAVHLPQRARQRYGFHRMASRRSICTAAREVYSLPRIRSGASGITCSASPLLAGMPRASRHRQE